MAKSKKTTVDRRSFLKTAAGAAGLVAIPPVIQARPDDPKPRGVTPIMPKDAEVREPASVESLTTNRTGSDFMVDVIKALGFEYVIANPGSSFRGLHESLINYGDNKNPEFITCCHEESSIAMAHGYAKIEGKPALTLAHGTVGLQHATMGIYNAFCDRAPIYLIVGNSIDVMSFGIAGGVLHAVRVHPAKITFQNEEMGQSSRCPLLPVRINATSASERQCRRRRPEARSRA